MPPAHAHIFRHEIRLFDRHVELALLGKFEHQHFRSTGLARLGRQRRDAFIERNAVMKMYDVIAVRDFGEVERLMLAAQTH